MRENNLIIICVTVIICIALIAGTFIIINHDNTDNQNDNSDSSANEVNTNNNNQNTQNNENTASSSPNTFNKINWATFYADGNPNTGEQVTINVGSQYANHQFDVSMTYYRDGYVLIDEPTQTYVVNSEGNIYVPDTLSMAKYPDKCTITLSHDGDSVTGTCNLEKRKGSQTAYFN